jgi:hypothetical protein
MRFFVPILKLNPRLIQKFYFSSLMLLTPPVTANIIQCTPCSSNFAKCLPQSYKTCLALIPPTPAPEKVMPFLTATIKTQRTRIENLKKVILPPLDNSQDNQPLLAKLIGRRPLSIIDQVEAEADFAVNPYKIAVVDTLKKNFHNDGFLGAMWKAPEFKLQRINFIGNYLVKLEDVLCTQSETLASPNCSGSKLSGLPAEFKSNLPIIMRQDMVDEAFDILHKLKIITPEDEYSIFF